MVSNYPDQSHNMRGGKIFLVIREFQWIHFEWVPGILLCGFGLVDCLSLKQIVGLRGAYLNLMNVFDTFKCQIKYHKFEVRILAISLKNKAELSEMV